MLKQPHAEMLTDYDIATLYEVLDPEPINVATLTVGDLCRILADASHIEVVAKQIADKDEVRAVRVAKGITQGVEVLLKLIQRWQPKPSADQKAAAEGVEFPSLAETILLETVEAYHLHSTEEAERLPVGDWLIYHKQQSASAMYQANYDAQQRRKLEQDRQQRKH